MNVFYNKTVLITGHTGFKGSWLCAWLHMLGANIIGYSDKVPTNPSNFLLSGINGFITDIRGDIRDLDKLKILIDDIKPDFVFHLAAQSLVKNAYENPLNTISVNCVGSTAVLESFRLASSKAVLVMITSDKVYDNVEWEWGYRENDQIGGKDPYSSSKGMAELAIKTYTESFFKSADSHIKVGVARAGNVIGGGDWADARIIPDCIRAIVANEPIQIRNPQSTRPWQHVLEPLSGYLRLANMLYKSKGLNGESFNFGPAADQNCSVGKLIQDMGLQLDGLTYEIVGNDINDKPEAGLLKLNCDKALIKLNWKPSLNYQQTVELTADWYRNFIKSDQKECSMHDLTFKQISDYGKFFDLALLE